MFVRSVVARSIFMWCLYPVEREMSKKQSVVDAEAINQKIIDACAKDTSHVKKISSSF